MSTFALSKSAPAGKSVLPNPNSIKNLRLNSAADSALKWGVGIVAPIIKTVHGPRKQIGDTLSVAIKSAGIDQAVKAVLQPEGDRPRQLQLEEGQLDELGYKFLKAKKNQGVHPHFSTQRRSLSEIQKYV